MLSALKSRIPPPTDARSRSIPSGKPIYPEPRPNSGKLECTRATARANRLPEGTVSIGDAQHSRWAAGKFLLHLRPEQLGSRPRKQQAASGWSRSEESLWPA